jgi:ABC-type sugar transport system ATPase subunit
VYPVADRFVILNKGVKIGEFDREKHEAEEIIEMVASSEGVL